MKRCIIMGAGDFCRPNTEITENDLVIAVDGGYRPLSDLGIRIDLAVGDFDSLGFVPALENALVLPCEKDDTDMLAALREGLKRGCDDFLLYGGTGGRIAHTLANIQCLAFLLESGARGRLIDEKYVITAVRNGSISFPTRKNGYISVFSFSDTSNGVDLVGLKYPLSAATLTSSFPIGVSNEFVGRAAEISVKSGTLIIVSERDINDDR